MLHFFESVNLFCQKLCLSQINIPINRAALGCGKWFWLHSWSQCFWMGAHTTGVSSLFETPQTSDYNNNTAGANLLLWTLPYSLHCFFLSHSNCFATFPCSVSPARPTRVRSRGRVGSWINDMLHGLWLSQKESLSPAASCQWRASGVIQPVIRQQKAQRSAGPFFTVDAAAYSSLKFYLECYSRCVWFEWIPHSPKVFRIKIQVVREQGCRCPRCPRSISLYGERVCMAANMATDEGTDDSAAFLLG